MWSVLSQLFLDVEAACWMVSVKYYYVFSWHTYAHSLYPNIGLCSAAENVWVPKNWKAKGVIKKIYDNF